MLKKIIYIVVMKEAVVDTSALVVAAAGWPGCTVDLVLFSIKNNTLTEVTVGLH